MITYQDLLANHNGDDVLMDFIYQTISIHKNSEEYKTACIADEYDRQENTTIVSYQKLLYKASGEAVPDNFSANYKLCSNFFNRFIVQQNQYLLGNGVTWNEKSTADKLGKDFDTRLQELGHDALSGGTAFGFWNFDHLEGFNLREFVPLYDEEDGALKAGIRFWQIDDLKPLRATLYELDGYTDYIWNKRKENGVDVIKSEILHPKRTYQQIVKVTQADGEEIFDGKNYNGFPIVPLFANSHKQSEIVGIRQSIDAYDLIKSGFANDLDDASQIYWTIQNAGGMDDIDLVKFVEHMKTIKAAVVEDNGARAESHTVEVPYASREALLDRIRSDLYDDYMALDVKQIVGGQATATQIKASYEPMNAKADLYEYQIIDFIQRLFKIIGIEDDPTFTRSMIVNANEEIQVILQASQYLPEDYVTEKIVTILGDADRVEDILEQNDMDNIERMPVGNAETTENGAETTETPDDEEVVEQAEDVAGKALNGAQTQSLIMIMDKYSQDGLSKEQAVNMIAVAIGISKDKAREIVEGL